MITNNFIFKMFSFIGCYMLFLFKTGGTTHSYAYELTQVVVAVANLLLNAFIGGWETHLHINQQIS